MPIQVSSSNSHAIVDKLVASMDEETHVEVRDRKHRISFLFLAGKARHPTRDHSLDGPTDLAALRHEAKSFHRRFQVLVKNEAHQSSALTHTRKSGLVWCNFSNSMAVRQV